MFRSYTYNEATRSVAQMIDFSHTRQQHADTINAKRQGSMIKFR